MGKQFDGLFGDRVRGLVAATTTILRQSLWLMLLLLGWASSAQAAIPASERQVLLDLYASTNGAGWITNTGWNGAAGTECSWVGITCDATQSNVTQIGLQSNNLVGTLPALSGLMALQSFSVSFNQLTGTIPALSGLTALQYFHVYNNQLTGAIPALSGLTALQYFYVYNNQLTGPIPDLSGLTALQEFFVYDNQLAGPIPDLSGLTALQSFIVSGNQLIGTIPAPPASLHAGWNYLCGNSLASSGDPAIDAAWVAATGVNWLACQTGYAPPSCALTASPASITAGGSSTLTASCSPAAMSYTWSDAGCAPSSATCAVAPTVTTTYTVTGNNAGGTGSAASVTVTAAKHLLAVTLPGTGYGNVASSPGGVSCYAPEPNVNYLVAPDCSESYASGIAVTLTATPASGSTFFGWGGACSGTASCVVTMNAAKSVTATFKAAPFVATTTSIITATSATISTTVSFAPADVGKTGAVYITAWAPASGLTALGILAAPMSHAMSVTTTRDNPYSDGAINTRQETLAAVLAAADPNAFVLVQLTSTGWQLVQNGQLIPYASGVLGDALSSLSILNNANPSNLLGAQFCVGYGTTAAEMVASGRMMPVADIPGSTVATNGSCNVAANPYKGLWWNPAENGWGMSITQHDSINFVALYTYDQSTQPVWYVMSSCPIVTAGSCTGDIYKVTGGKPPTAAWVALNFAQALSTAGSGTLTFSDANNGRFDFTLNGVPGSKIIQRQLFSSGTAAQAVDYSDLWWNANESGWGLALTQDVGMIFATWYTYDAAGMPVWYVASSCPLSGSGCTGDVYKVTGGEALTAAWNGINPPATVGTVTFTFSDSSTGTMSYTIEGIAGSKAIVRQAF